MKKEFVVYQYIIQNMQEMCIPNYLMSKEYYPNIKECKKDWEFEGPEFRVRHAYRKSKLSGNDAYLLWGHAKKKREQRARDKSALRRKNEG